MATAKSKAPTKRTAKAAAAPRVPTARADGRPKSALSIAGDQAKLEAETALLRATLEAHGWNATKAGLALGIRSVPTVLRQIERCGLRAEYEKHGQ